MTGDTIDVLVVAEPGERDAMRCMLVEESGRRYACAEAGSGEEALAACGADARDAGGRFDAMLVAARLPDTTGLALLTEIARARGELPCAAVVVADGLAPDEAAAIRRTGAHVMGRGWMTPESLTHVLDGARERFDLARELAATRRRVEQDERRLWERIEVLEAACDAAPLGIFLLDERLLTIRVNAALAAFDGIPLEGHAGKSPRDTMAPELADRMLPLIARVFETGVPIVNQVHQGASRAGPGARRDFSVSINPVRRADGSIRGIIGVVQEVTALEAAHEELRKREERLRLALDTAQMGWWEWDVERDVVRLSENLYDALGVTPDALGGGFGTIRELIHPEDRERVDRAIAATLEHDVPYDVELRFVRRDGSSRWALARGVVQRAPDGRPLTFTGVDKDITARKESDAEREALLVAERAARAEAERLGREKDEFVATLSHELRTPLNAIMGYSHILREKIGDAAATKKAIDVIARNTELQVQLVDDLLDMNRILSGKLRLHPRPISLVEVALAAIDTIRPAATAKALHLHLDAAIGDSAEVYGDPDRLQQVLWNLLSNAVKFTERGSVRLAIARREGSVVASVEDTGEGIAPDFLPHVFDRFRQADASASRRHYGLGLGLAIVRTIVEMHGGTVHVSSDGADRGSTFTIALPSQGGPRPTLPSIELGATPVTPTAADEDLARGAHLAGCRVLVVDDHVDAREFTRFVLAERGAHVVVSSGAKEALAALAAASFDLLVADLGLPGTDGFELMREVRRGDAERAAHTPALALTAFARAEDRARAFDAGYDEHLAKPVRPAALVAAVARLLRPIGS